MSQSNLTLKFNRLLTALTQLTKQIEQDKNIAAWVFDTNRKELMGAEARRQFVNVLELLEFTDDRDGRETDICPGIIGASPQTLWLAAELNQAKDQFKQAVIAMNKLEKQGAHRVMKQHGYPRVHFKQIYRHIPIILKKPESIRFTWGATRSIKRISRQEAYRRLVEAAGDNPSYGYQQQFQALEALPKDEFIAIVQDLKPHIKANLCWIQRQMEEKRITRKMISAALAILVPLNPGESLPKHHASFPDDRKKRKPRGDFKIEPEPFLPSIRGHRYLKSLNQPVVSEDQQDESQNSSA
ncbi:MAG: hypothetical protein AXA67_12765 [Methylothermaceae bacteria B42]|nr:MAG: hypothetical protein AXA67_12765 [Methylothermaceae bacteria B42]HHJ38505.1 hypothetical protein [Methylothermaceae bacterium]